MPAGLSITDLPPPAGKALIKRRHRAVILSFALIVALPVLVCGAYLWLRAADQFNSKVAFVVRREESGSAIDFIGGIAGVTSSSSKDTDILYEYLHSQQLVAEMDKQIDLRAIWSRPGRSWWRAGADPYFTFDPDRPVEDLVDYWSRMVQVSYDNSSGLIEVNARAFDPQDAQAVTRALFARGAEMINRLSDIAREDAIRYTRVDLNETLERLKVARLAMAQFRNEHQMIDPSLDIQSQAGLMGNLQMALSNQMIELDMLKQSSLPSDPRIKDLQRRIEVVKAQIAQERLKLGLGGGGGDAAYAAIVGRYEELRIELEFSERTYVTALAAYDAALAEARRKSRYLAAYVEPTIAETSRFPQRGLNLFFLALFLSMIWALAVLVWYSVKDRR